MLKLPLRFLVCELTFSQQTFVSKLLKGFFTHVTKSLTLIVSNKEFRFYLVTAGVCNHHDTVEFYLVLTTLKIYLKKNSATTVVFFL